MSRLAWLTRECRDAEALYKQAVMETDRIIEEIMNKAIDGDNGRA